MSLFAAATVYMLRIRAVLPSKLRVLNLFIPADTPLPARPLGITYGYPPSQDNLFYNAP